MRDWPGSSKDFRTWAGTRIAARALRDKEPSRNERHTKSTVAEAIRIVSQSLGNTPTVCRSCYIHPVVLDAFADGTLASRLSRPPRVRGLSAEEAGVLALLETQQAWREQLRAAARAA